jgi:hypothetical protein
MTLALQLAPSQYVLHCLLPFQSQFQWPLTQSSVCVQLMLQYLP